MEDPKVLALEARIKCLEDLLESLIQKYNYHSHEQDRASKAVGGTKMNCWVRKP